MEEVINYPGEVYVETIELVTSTGRSVDLSSLFRDISLFEDMFSTSMSGYVLIEDALNLIEELPIVGEEYLNISLRTPTLNREIKKSFYVYKLQGRETKGRSQTYILNFCSIDLVRSENVKISKSFRGDIRKTIETIFLDKKYIGSQNTIYIDTPKNTLDFISAYWTPFEAINWIAGRSISKANIPDYMFYETNQSFEFTALTTLVSADVTRDYVYSDVNSGAVDGSLGDIEKRYNVVEIFKNDTTFDYLRGLNSGMFAASLYTFDYTTKKFEKTTYDYVTDFDKVGHLNKFCLHSSALPRTPESSMTFAGQNSYIFPNKMNTLPADYFLRRNSLREQFTEFKVSIKVFGRTDIKVGNVVTLNIPQSREILKDDITGDVSSKYYSGKYLITAIRHQITDNKHGMVLELVKDSFVEKII